MLLKYLGTGASEGWPALFCICEMCQGARRLGGKNIRTRSQAIIDNTLLVDFPADTYAHMLANNLAFCDIDHVIVTHSHSDHFYADDLYNRMPPFSNGQKNPLKVYGNSHVQALYENCDSAEPVSSEVMEFIKMEAFTTYKIGGYWVTPMPAKHKREEECFIYLINDGKKTMLYGNDTGVFYDSVWKYLSDKHLDLVSLDCTFTQFAEGDNHMGLPDNVAVKKRLLEMGCANGDTIFIVNHFSHNGGLLHDDLERLAAGEGFLTTYDGMEVEF